MRLGLDVHKQVVFFLFFRLLLLSFLLSFCVSSLWVYINWHALKGEQVTHTHTETQHDLVRQVKRNLRIKQARVYKMSLSALGPSWQAPQRRSLSLTSSSPSRPAISALPAARRPARVVGLWSSFTN